jgi:tRNA nucleotidyltransferase (CCA-adding enzyme)
MRIPLYLVGGAVRDLYLGRPVRDVDLGVEGDGVRFARRLARDLGAPAREHPRFGTATVMLSEGARLDVATARTETYDRPGALPRIHPGSLAEDLARRDFTINAMALALAPGPPLLFDPYGGRADLARGVIRMLHPASARDDPTRAFRAVLYANRLGFRVEPRTRRWIGEAVREGVFRQISGDRLRREIARIFSEAGWASAVAWMSRLGLPNAVHPALSGDSPVRPRLKRLERLAADSPDGVTWLAPLLVWAADLTTKESRELGERLNLSRVPAGILRRWAESRRPGARVSSSVVSSDEALSAAAVGDGRSAAPLSREIRIRGRDLLAAGIPSGPAIGRALAAARSALRLGKITAEEELSFALDVAREARA